MVNVWVSVVVPAAPHWAGVPVAAFTLDGRLAETTFVAIEKSVVPTVASRGTLLPVHGAAEPVVQVWTFAVYWVTAMSKNGVVDEPAAGQEPEPSGQSMPTWTSRLGDEPAVGETGVAKPPHAVL